ncbi:MAG: hypothetical protein ABSE07_02295 [Methanoregula sp.]|jgi:hypothetical protein
MEERYNRLVGLNVITGYNLSLDHDPVATRTGITSRQVKEYLKKEALKEQQK